MLAWIWAWVRAVLHRRINCILWGNEAVTAGPQIAVIQAGNAFAPTLTTVERCVVQDGPAAVWLGNPGYVLEWGAGNLLEDPLFVDPRGGDFTLSAASPCDAGDRVWLPPDRHDIDGDGDKLELLPLDLQGFARIQGRPPLLDLGALEH